MRQEDYGIRIHNYAAFKDDIDLPFNKNAKLLTLANRYGPIWLTSSTWQFKIGVSKNLLGNKDRAIIRFYKVFDSDELIELGSKKLDTHNISNVDFNKLVLKTFCDFKKEFISETKKALNKVEEDLEDYIL